MTTKIEKLTEAVNEQRKIMIETDVKMEKAREDHSAAYHKMEELESKLKKELMKEL